MKQGRTIGDLAAELQRQVATKADYIASTARMNFLTSERGGDEPTGPSTLVVDGVPGEDGGLGEFRILDHAHGQIADRLGIPKKYYDRLRADAPGLLDENVNHWLHDQPERRMIRTLDGNARAFLSDRYRRLDNIDLIENILPVLSEQPDMKIVSCELTERRLYLKALFPRIQDDVPGIGLGNAEVGDLVQAGVVISNSEVGSGSLSVEPLAYVLACKNGMISSYAMRRYHVGKRVEENEETARIFSDETLRADDKAFWLKVTDVVRAAANEAEFTRIVDGLRELRDLKPEGDPVGVVERLQDRSDLSDDERGSVLTHLIEGGDLSVLGVLNAVTRASQDVDDYDRATELERLGGKILAEPALVGAK